MHKMIAATALALCAAACSPQAPGNSENSNGAEPTATSQPASAPAEPAAPAKPAAGNKVLTLEGLGPVRIGQAPPAGWSERGAQISEGCRTVTSPDYPGVYAIVEGGKVRRVTVGQRSDVKLIEGIGVGATEADVRAAFPGFRAQSHKYEDSPAKYLTAPNAASGDPALRFEIGKDGKVSLMHVGTMPALGYVEGCA